MKMKYSMVLLLSILFLSACTDDGGDEGGGASGAVPERPYTDFFSSISDTPVYPESNGYSIEKETLGEFLFWDPVLSGDMNVACASCHHPEQAWADGIPVSIGVDGVGLGPAREGSLKTPFHSPSILNVAFTSGGFFWDLRAATLEEQALGPIKNAIEMRGESFSESGIMPEIIHRLENNAEYVALFEAAFGPGSTISETTIAQALAMFQRKIITPRTRFDDFIDGDATALSSQEITGLNKFINGGCADCHSGPMLSDFTIHSDRPILLGKPAVRTPGLRNVELTAPYMHDGSKPTLRAALLEYEERGDLDVTFDDDDVEDVSTFLNVLTNHDFYKDIPAYVPSGLPVGGDI